MSVPLSLWQVTLNDNNSGRAESFAVSGGEDEDVSVWSIDLPTDTTQAQKVLAQQTDMLVRRQIATEKVGVFLQQYDDPLNTAHSYALDQTNIALPEEEVLWQQLQRPFPDQPLSFGIRDTISNLADGDTIVKEFQQFLSQTTYLLRPTMRISSRQGQSSFAQTTVQAAGKLETIWQRGIQLEQQSLHQETVKMTLETRSAILSFLSHITAGAVALSARFSITSALALPAVFQFAYSVMSRAKEDQLLQRIQQLSQL